MTKKTKKPAFKPVFTVDLTECYDAEEMYEALLTAKFEAKVPFTNYEVGKYCEYKICQALDTFIDDLFAGHNAVIIDDDTIKSFDAVKIEITPEKKPWYKRFWNWITRKK